MARSAGTGSARLVKPSGTLSVVLAVLVVVVSYGAPLLLALGLDLRVCGRGDCSGSVGLDPVNVLLLVVIATVLFLWMWNPVVSWANRWRRDDRA